MTEEMSLAVFNPIRATLAELKKKDESLVFDHTTPEGEKALRSWVKRLRGFKGDVARAHKDTKAEALAFGRKVDAVKNELTTEADAIITKRMKPLDEIEAKKRAAAEAILEAERLAKEKAERERLADLERREAEAAKREAAIKEKERIEREKNIAFEAAEQARKDAIKKVEREKKEAIKKAEREKQEAIEAEKEKARKAEAERQAKVEAERQAKVDADKAEQARLAEVERKRVENKKHREEIEKGIVDSLKSITGNEKLSKIIVKHLVAGNVPNITINY